MIFQCNLLVTTFTHFLLNIWFNLIFLRYIDKNTNIIKDTNWKPIKIKYLEKDNRWSKILILIYEFQDNLRYFLKFIKIPGHLSNSRTFQDFPGPWLQWANTYKSSGSQFFTATTGIQPGQVTFKESRSTMTSLTKSRVTGILCSLILILERKEGEQIPESSRLEFVKEI